MNMTATTFSRRFPTGESAAPPETTALCDAPHVEDPAHAEMGWAARLVTEDSHAPFSELGRRAAIGLGLSSLYGVALGAREGGRALATHALGVPLGLLLVVAVGAPSVFVFLSMCRAPIDARAIAGTAARGIGSAGLLLAGLAPAAALFVVSSETAVAASSAVVAGLLLGGGVALARMTWDIFRSAVRGQEGSFLGGMTVSLGFSAFAVLLAIRIWCAVLPILRGVS
jgi:hypothetical protein